MLAGAATVAQRVGRVAWGVVADGDGDGFERLLLRRVKACQARAPSRPPLRPVGSLGPLALDGSIYGALLRRVWACRRARPPLALTRIQPCWTRTRRRPACPRAPHPPARMIGSAAAGRAAGRDPGAQRQPGPRSGTPFHLDPYPAHVPGPHTPPPHAPRHPLARAPAQASGGKGRRRPGPCAHAPPPPLPLPSSGPLAPPSPPRIAPCAPSRRAGAGAGRWGSRARRRGRRCWRESCRTLRRVKRGGMGDESE